MVGYLFLLSLYRTNKITAMTIEQNEQAKTKVLFELANKLQTLNTLVLTDAEKKLVAELDTAFYNLANIILG